jgi:hypothetical protein
VIYTLNRNSTTSPSASGRLGAVAATKTFANRPLPILSPLSEVGR